MSALVKGVFSGDTILLQGKAASATATAPERQLTLTNITAPRFSRSKNVTDEPFAFESREWLRKKCLGKAVAFRVVHQHPSGREYGIVTVDGEDLASALVSAGWASARAQKEDATPSASKSDRDALTALEAEAKAAQRGMHAFTAAVAKQHVRSIDFAPDARTLFDRYKGKVVAGVIDQVRDGSTVRVELLLNPATFEHAVIILHLAGVQCPRVPLPLAVLQAQQAALLADDPSARVEPVREETPAPFAVEAKLFVENRLLHRDVGVRLEGVDKSGNFFGTLEFPQGNITHSLLKAGLGKSVEWSAKLTATPQAIVDAENVAKQTRARLWANYVPLAPAAASAAAPNAVMNRKDFQAKVVAVQSGDCIVVDPEGSGGRERKLFLSSLRAPRAGPGPAEQPWGRDAKEALRTRLIGKRVHVVVDYVRTDAAPGKNEERVFATVNQGNANVALALVAAGLAEVVRHRMEEDRSAHYEALLEAEAKAKQEKKCMHSGHPPAPYTIVDLSVRPPRSAQSETEATAARQVTAKCRQYLPMFQRERQMRAIVDYVFSGSRVKLVVPKENCVIALALSGIKCPRPASGADAGEPFGDEALRFVRSSIMQHDVRVEVETLDKGDNFLGAIHYGGDVGKQKNLAVELLAAGLATVMEFSAERSPHSVALFDAQAAAKTARIGVWKNWVEPVPKAEEPVESEDVVATAADGRFVRLRVTDVQSATHFSAQVVGDENLAAIQDRMQEFTETSRAPIKPFAPKRGTVCAVQFSDGQWYRGRVEARSESEGAAVFFLDFGNKESNVEAERLRPLEGEYADMQSAAACSVACRLSALRAPKVDSEFFEDSIGALSSLTMDRELLSRVDITRDKSGVMHVTAWLEQEADGAAIDVTGQGSINQTMARDGWARVERYPDARTPTELVALLRGDETMAKKDRVSIWSYGDVASDGEEEEADKKRKQNAWAKRA